MQDSISLFYISGDMLRVPGVLRNLDPRILKALVLPLYHDQLDWTYLCCNFIFELLCCYCILSRAYITQKSNVKSKLVNLLQHSLEFYSYGAKKREDSDIPSDKVLLDVNVIL